MSNWKRENRQEGDWKTPNTRKNKQSYNANNDNNSSSYRNTRSQSLSSRPRSSHDKRSSSQLRENTQNINSEETDRVPNIHNQKAKRPRVLGYTALKELSMKEPVEILQTISNSHSGFDELLNSKIKPDFMVLIMKVICKACSTDFPELKKRTLLLACNDNFLDEINQFIMSFNLNISEENKRRIKPFCENVLVFYQTLIEMMPNLAVEKLRSLLIVTDMNLRACIDYAGVTIEVSILQKLKQLIEDLGLLAKSKEENDSKLNKGENYIPPPVDNFREIIIYPQPNDIHGKRPFLRKNIEKGSFHGVEQYLDLQFRLLREDFISPLRNAINEYMGKEPEEKTKKIKKKFTSVRVYNKVRFLKPKTTLNKVCYEVCFDVDNKIKNVQWENSKKFMFGSLLLFSKNNFSSFFLGVVANRELAELQKKLISVDLVYSEDNSISAKDLMSYNFQMVESEVYFEPYFNVLNALKNLNSGNFPFINQIVHGKCEPSPPKYIQNNMDVYKITVNNPSNNLPNQYTFHLLGYDWPSASELYLDSSQYAAYKAALTNEFVVIQGPPGTGKTFLGLRIAEALLGNKTIWNYPSSPILVVCFTNHALDQFLEGMLPLTQNIIRVGGQSKNQNLAPFNLRDRRISAMHSATQSNLLRDLRKRLTNMFYTIKTIQGKIEILDKRHGVVSLKTLKCVLPSEFMLGNFNNQDEHLMEWLLEGVTDLMRSKQNLAKLTNCGNVENVVLLRDDDKPMVDEEDFENTERMKNVFLDIMEFDKVTTEPSEVEVHYACTRNKIFDKEAELKSILETLPEQNLSRSEMHNVMKNVRKTIDDLGIICAYLEKNLALTIDNVSKDFLVHLDKRIDVWLLKTDERWILYHSWIKRLTSWFTFEMAKCEELHRNDSKQYEETKQMEDLNIIKDADVVGITTSTAAKLRPILKELAPKIVIAEEAAEVLEAHIVASLTKNCQHLILIGDHKQLRPKPAEHKLAKDFHLDLSLFERMINNDMAANTLRTQHRMRPEVSSLLVPTIYKTLTDHVTVFNRENIKGMEKNVFFLNHNSFEVEMEDLQTKKNVFESKFIVGLARHLILQGYKANEITILTPYIGQMFEIKNEWKKYGLAPGLRITVVDNFQGEENKIILLSLVRSNKDAKIGFLGTENRVCVALSRARDGLYIVGNMDNLVASSAIWPKIKRSLIDKESYGTALILRCENHPKQLTQITSHKDFEQVIEGGCSQLCLNPLPCGHICKSLCHVTNKDHVLNKCNEPCTRVCVEGHNCRKKCYEVCGSCPELVLRILPCNHEVTVPCSTELETYVCKVQKRIRFKSCEHIGIVACAYIKTAKCMEPCEFRLDCGHKCERSCHVSDDPDHLKYICVKPCSRKPSGCTQSHECKRQCFDDCEKCVVEVLKTLDCGHQQKARCNENVVCNALCKRTLNCGHKCIKKCRLDCEPCTVTVTKTIEGCNHTMKMKCSLAAVSINCSGNCNKTLTCGHKCKRRCKDLCSYEFCVEPVEIRINLPCGHRTAAVPCNTSHTAIVTGVNPDDMLQYCSNLCGTLLDCGHMCSGTCGQCMQGRIHAVCDQPCGNVLICGHSCPVPCREVCPPCNKPCPFSCSHSKCPKKCGELCTPCKEPCTNNCPHYKCKKRCGDLCNRPACDHPCLKVFKCGHSCVGFCGEPCPPCKPCNPEEYEEFFYCGDETEDARYVLLEDCKHALEVNGLEQWLNIQPDNNEIVLKVCPKCKTTITKVHRFQNLIKQVLEDVRNIKIKTFGEIEDIRARRIKLLEKLRRSSFTMNDFPGYSADEDRLSKLHKLLKDELQIVKNHRRNEYDLQKTMLYNVMTDYVIDIEDRLSKVWQKLDGCCRKEVFTLVNFLISLLTKRERKISKNDIHAFLLELNRLHRWIDLFLIQSSVQFKQNQIPEVKNKYVEVKNRVSTLGVYSDLLDRAIERNLKELKTLSHTTILSSEEKRMINAAMATSFYGGAASTGHWFKCPKGHIYCITECGGAMEEARCPIQGCGAYIGGRHHTYRTDNRLASEMDGATHAAWSAGNNMANYHF